MVIDGSNVSLNIVDHKWIHQIVFMRLVQCVLLISSFIFFEQYFILCLWSSLLRPLCMSTLYN